MKKVFVYAIILIFSALFYTCAATPSSTGTGGSSSSAAPVVLPDYYVDAAAGLDTNPGTSGQPFQTITKALTTADSNKIIKVNPGTYNAALGETFPLVMKPGQVLIGDISNKGVGSTPTYIVGVGSVGISSYKAALVITNDNRVAGFLFKLLSLSTSEHCIFIEIGTGIVISNDTFTNDTDSYGGIYLDMQSAVIIENCDFGTSSYGILGYTTNSIIRNNKFLTMSLPIVLNYAYDTVVCNNLITGGNGQVGVMGGGVSLLIVSNTFNKSTGYNYGAIRPLDNMIVRYNVFTCASNAIEMSQSAKTPDIGTITNPGHNDFSGVTGAAYFIESGVAVTNYAIGNIWAHDPPTSADILFLGTGRVYWGTNTNTENVHNP
jgi:hypothetical protein